MRIAQIAPVWFTVPPSGYGGIELVVGLLTDELAQRGHDVTLFASGGSVSKAEVVSPFDQPPPDGLIGDVWYDAVHTLTAHLEADSFDVVHDHSGILGPAFSTVRGDADPVAVHTLHGPWTDVGRRFYALVHEHVHLVAISESQRGLNADIRYAATVHNGIDVDAYPLREDKEDYLLFIGRSVEDKGPVDAIEAAKQAGRPLKMVVKRHEDSEQHYWNDVVAKHLTSDVEVLDSVDHECKVELLQGAGAFLFPIRWPEPFGLVMAEAMACGTPVIAGNRGAATEIVADGETGRLCDSFEELVAAIDEVEDMDPEACRRRVVDRFSVAAMVDGYEELYRRLAA